MNIVVCIKQVPDSDKVTIDRETNRLNRAGVPSIINPFDEAECGHHYARAMASWAAVLAMTGFRYSAVDGAIAFAATARVSTTFWSTGYGWGVLEQRRGSAVWSVV